MNKFIKVFLITIAVLIAAYLILLLLPPTKKIQQSATNNTPEDLVINEGISTTNSEIPEVQDLDLPEKLFIAKKDIISEEETRTYIDETTKEAEKKLVEKELDASLPKISLFYSSEEGKKELAAGKSISKEVDIDGFQLIKLKGKALKMIHKGSYETIDGAYISLMNYQNLKGYTSTGVIVEEYLVDGSTEEDSTKWQTAVYMYVE